MGFGHNVLGLWSAGGNPFIQMPHCEVLHVRRALQYHLSVPANIVWSIPKMPQIDRARKLTCLPLRAPPLLSMACNYEIWTSLWSLQPDGISIFQPPNEIRPESNGGRREGKVNLL